jgi:hypothetical protein
MGWMYDNIGRLIARLQKSANHCEPPTPNYLTALRDTLQPGDVLLVEGKGSISGIIKYLTQSTWSHRHCTSGRLRAPQPTASPTF